MDLKNHVWEHGHNNRSYRVAEGHRMDCVECIYLYYRDIGGGINFHEAKALAQEIKAHPPTDIGIKVERK
jgi:hypothetical protein